MIRKLESGYHLYPNKVNPKTHILTNLDVGLTVPV
jgi:hypothetical protein